jgi:hypothetical protein
LTCPDAGERHAARWNMRGDLVENKEVELIMSDRWFR